MAYLVETSLTTRTETVYTFHPYVDDNNTQQHGGGFRKLVTPFTSYSSFTTFPLSLIPNTSTAKYFAYLPFTSLVPFFKRLFLPRGKVSEEYLQFQFCDSVQATCSYLRGVLTIHSILVGVGVGTENASALAATLSFLLRDGASRIGSLLFSYLFALTLDAEIKFWRIFADVINDVGLTLELLAPLAGTEYFVIVLCIANICKALCGVAAEATRVAISAHFARENNMAEVQAKEGSQENAITLLGMGLGYLLAPYLNASPYHQYITFGLLTLIHVIANWYGVRILALRTLNRGRLRIHTLHWLPTMLNNITNLSTSNYFLQNNQHTYSHPSSLVLSPSSRAISAAHHIEPLPQPFTAQEIATVEPIFPIHYYSTIENYLYKCIPSVLRSFCCVRRTLASGSSLSSLRKNGTTIDHIDTTGTMFRTSRTPNSNDGQKDHQYILTDYAIKDEGMRLHLGTSLPILQSIASIDNGVGTDNKDDLSNLAWTKHVYVAMSTIDTMDNTVSSSSMASFIWSNLSDVLEILNSSDPSMTYRIHKLAQQQENNHGSIGASSPVRTPPKNNIRKRRNSVSTDTALPSVLTRTETHDDPVLSWSTSSSPLPGSSSSSSLSRSKEEWSNSKNKNQNPSAQTIAKTFIASRISGIPINGFCISGHSLSMNLSGSTNGSNTSNGKVVDTDRPVIGVTYFNGITSSMKLAAYLTAHIASQIGGLTASLLMDIDTTPLGSALRICCTDWSILIQNSHHSHRQPYSPGAQVPSQPQYTDILYKSLLEQYIYQLKLGEWDTEGLQLAEDGYRISL